MIGVSVLNHRVHKLMIQGQSLALVIRTVGTLSLNTNFLPLVGHFREAAWAFVPL